VLNNHVDDVTDTVLSFVGLDRWVELDSTVLKGDLDVEDRGKLVVLVVLDVDLLGKVSH